ncbi:DNA-3-methyladenine glycosylase family protein [Actinomycetota bacterium]
MEAEAWGSGAQWLLDGIPELLGDADDDSAFVAHHPQVAEAHRAHADWRISRSRQVVQSLVPTVIEQRVTGAEAFASYRRLVQAFGESAPRPSESPRLWVPPDAKGWVAIPSWEWLRAGVDAARSDAVMRAAAYAGRLEECVDLPLAQAHSRLRALPGVGVWTAAEVAQRALGDPDAVSFGDYHVARDIGFALTGVEADDAGMERLLEPYRGHRYRVQALLGLAGHRRPRHGARRSLPTHLPRRFR